MSRTSALRALSFDGGASTVTKKTEATFPNFNREHNDPERKWQIDVQRQLFKLTRLEDDWDGYGTPPLRMDTAFFALLLLDSVMKARTPVPQVVPSSVGGVQLEWHEKDIDFEIHVREPYVCEYWFEDHRTPQTPPRSEEISMDFSPLVTPMQLLTTR